MKIDPSKIYSTPAPNPLFAPTTEPFPKEQIPEAIYEEDPSLTAFWEIAWRIAWKHVYCSGNTPVSPYLGEGCATNKIWIWDSCFMALWGCYANHIFPVANTLDNLYAIMGSRKSGITIHHPDNPPLFGWAELELYRHTADRKRICNLIENKTLQNHYWWLEKTASPGDFLSWSDSDPVMLRHLEHGYLWSGCPSGMDNTPRGRGSYQYLLWVDALAQQGMFARDIAHLCRIAGKDADAKQFTAEYEAKKALMQLYFDTEDGCFYDRTLSRPGYGGFVKVLTPASFWPVFAGMATEEQTKSMVNTLLDSNKLGGPVACPSVSRSDPDFNPLGAYWRGSVWLPTFYMVMKALDKNGEQTLARKLSLQLIHWMKDCYDQVEPHTIWECYSPTEPMPATSKTEKYSRMDFCGWSALAPISLFLEDVIGINVDATTMTVQWTPPETKGKCGIRNLRLGKNMVSLIKNQGKFEVSTRQPMTLFINDAKFDLPAGNHLL